MEQRHYALVINTETGESRELGGFFENTPTAARTARARYNICDADFFASGLHQSTTLAISTCERVGNEWRERQIFKQEAA